MIDTLMYPRICLLIEFLFSLLNTNMNETRLRFCQSKLDDLSCHTNSLCRYEAIAAI